MSGAALAVWFAFFSLTLLCRTFRLGFRRAPLFEALCGEAIPAACDVRSILAHSRFALPKRLEIGLLSSTWDPRREIDEHGMLNLAILYRSLEPKCLRTQTVVTCSSRLIGWGGPLFHPPSLDGGPFCSPLVILEATLLLYSRACTSSTRRRCMH